MNEVYLGKIRRLKVAIYNIDAAGKEERKEDAIQSMVTGIE